MEEQTDSASEVIGNVSIIDENKTEPVVPVIFYNTSVLLSERCFNRNLLQ